MKVLVACEFSGIVRDAFIAEGYDAVSCDLIPTEQPGPHIQDDVLRVIEREQFDMMIAFPPCTHLASSGARWFKDKQKKQREAIEFVLSLANSNIERIAIENPIGVLSTKWRKPDQIIQPWQFGHGEVKSTCLWLKNLPVLSQQKLLMVVYLVYTSNRQGLTDGNVVVVPIAVLRPQW